MGVVIAIPVFFQEALVAVFLVVSVVFLGAILVAVLCLTRVGFLRGHFFLR